MGIKKDYKEFYRCYRLFKPAMERMLNEHINNPVMPKSVNDLFLFVDSNYSRRKLKREDFISFHYQNS